MQTIKVCLCRRVLILLFTYYFLPWKKNIFYQNNFIVNDQIKFVKLEYLTLNEKSYRFINLLQFFQFIFLFCYLKVNNRIYLCVCYFCL